GQREDRRAETCRPDGRRPLDDQDGVRSERAGADLLDEPERSLLFPHRGFVPDNAGQPEVAPEPQAGAFDGTDGVDHRHEPALHVLGPPAPDPGAVAARRPCLADRDRVYVAIEHQTWAVASAWEMGDNVRPSRLDILNDYVPAAATHQAGE